MKAILYFSIDLPYVLSEYKQLLSRAVSVHRLGHGLSRWTFKAIDIDWVTQLTARTYEFCDEDSTKLYQYSPLLIRTVPNKADKHGIGYWKIIHKSPKLFICESMSNQKPVRRKIPTENIKVAWKVIEEMKLNRKIKSITVSKNIIERLGIARYHRAESNSFDKGKFFGERKDYFRYFYDPIKVLQSEGVLRHHTNGYVERIKDDWDIQSIFEPMEV